MRSLSAASLLLVVSSLFCRTLSAQTFTTTTQTPEALPPVQSGGSDWFFKDRIDIRANYRDSQEAKFPLKFPFPSDFLPVGQSVGYEETVDAGQYGELSVADLTLEIGHGSNFLARAKVHAQDKYRRNPTSEDKKVDADELYLRFGQKPEFLDRPDKTSFFLQLGKAPKMEKQPVRLLESYGLAATSFNRFEDIQALLGGTVGRNFYWRLQLANGNPFYFRDSNALAGDNGIKELLQVHPDPRLKSGFPIFYNAEVEGYWFDTHHMQTGEGIGYRWQNGDQTAGYDAIAFHYRRTMAEAADLTGTFYNGDLEFLRGVFGIGLPISGRTKEETGGRIYAEFHGLTAIAQFTKQAVAGLHRQGEELEVGYLIPVGVGPSVGGESLIQSIQPALRLSGLQNRFRGPAQYVAPSVWWNWVKFDYGVRLGLAKFTDITVERTKHNVVAPMKLDLDETLVTIRVHV